MEAASVAYKYRLFTLGSIRLVARCEVHCWTNKRGELVAVMGVIFAVSWCSLLAHPFSWCFDQYVYTVFASITAHDYHLYLLHSTNQLFTRC